MKNIIGHSDCQIQFIKYIEEFFQYFISLWLLTSLVLDHSSTLVNARSSNK